MRAEGALPNNFTFTGVFTAASNSAEYTTQIALQTHCLAVKMGSCTDVFAGTSLLTLYCRLGFLADARNVFDRMPERNSFSWASMFTGYAADKLGDEAFALFRTMIDEGECHPNEFVFTSVLSAVSVPEFHDMGRQVHCLAVKGGAVSFVSVENSLVTLYAKCEKLGDAVVMFESSGEKNAITWSAMITACAQNGEPGKAVELFSEMHAEGVRPSEFTFVGVLNACSDQMILVEGKQAHGYLLKMGLELQLFIKSALVDMYAKCGCVEDARKGFDELQGDDIVLWSTMIAGYVQNGEHEEALALYGRLEKEGILPNNLTMATVLRACSSLAALQEGKQIHARTLKYGLNLGVPIGSALSTMYAKCGGLDDCSLVFRRIPHRDTIAWNSIISAFSQNGRGNDALDLFEEMKSEGVEPDDVTFVNVLSACSHTGLVDKGRELFQSMNDVHGIVPRVEHYACMVDVLSRAGMFVEAKEFIESISIDHGMCLWRIVLGACRDDRSLDIGAYAGEKLMELGSQDSSAYILLSNIYASQNRWDDVERVRRMMRLRGVNKEPGCSWVELNNRVHVFVVGEQLHPDYMDIYDEVKRLRKNMRDEGYDPGSGFPLRDYSEFGEGSQHEQEWQLIASAV